MKKRILSILLALCLCLSIIPMSSLSTAAKTVDDDLVETGFSPDNFKAQIKKVSIGAPITGTDGKKYLPVDVHFFAAENLSDSDMVYFLEGYLKAQLKGGGLAESIRGLGMTLMGPLKTDVPLESNMWNWDWTPYETGGGQGVIKYNVPLLEESETQSVEQSQATGMTEVNGVKVGDEITLQNETVVNTNNIPEQIVQELFPDGPSVFSDPVTFTVEEASKYPKEITISTDDKTVAPPEEVVLPYTGQPQDCPYTATAGYTVSLNDPQTDAGIYTAALILNSGWKWTDGTDAAKPAVWAINKATITSVTLSANQLTYNGKDQTPTITSVKAGNLTVPAGGYTATFPEPSKFSGNYTVTVKGKGNFTGSASADYSIVAIYADTCNHIEYPREYVDNKDNATHKAFCTHCGGCLANAEKHDLKNEPVNDPETGKPAGKYRTVCTKCSYAIDGTCDHSVPREYVDNGNGTHNERCSRCHVVFTANEAHDLKATAVLSNVSGYEIYNGEVSVDCTKCSYHEDQLCSHAGTGRDDYVPAKGSYPNFTHRSHCTRCKKLMFEEEEACTPGEWEPKGLAAHHTHCTKCGQEITGYHDFKGTRKITKFEATPYKGGLFNLFTRYNYRCYYTETCKDCHGVRQGWFDYPIIDVERWADYRAAFESIVKMNPEDLQSFSDQDYLEGYKYFLMIPSWFLSSLYEATGTNEMNFANLQSGWLTKLTNTDEAGSCKMFDKNGKEIASYKPKDKKSVAPTGSDELAATGDDEGISEDELDTWRFTEEDGAVVALSTNYLMSLEDGEYSYTACFSNENGQTAAITMVFNIVSDDNGKKVTNLHPLGTMVNADGGIVSMNLSDEYVPFTGEPITPPAVTLTSEMGVEYAEGEDYTLTYYQVVDGVEGEPIEVEIAKEELKDIGTYNVVATPTRNGVLSGEAWAQFSIVETPPKLLGDVDGSGIVDTVDVTFIQRHLLSIYIPFDFDEALADVDGEDGVNIVDVTWLQRWLVHMNAPKGIGQPIPDPDDISRSSLTGVWVYEEDENFVYTFNANGTGSYEVYGETINFTYTDNGTSVEIVFDDAPGTFDYTIDGNTLVLVDSTCTEVRYIKQ